MNEIAQAVDVDTETLEDQLESIFTELNLALKWKRPSILFAIYNSRLIRQSAQDGLENIIVNAGQTVVHYQIEYDQKINLVQFVDEITQHGNAILYIDPLHSDSRDSQIQHLVTMLNSCRSYLVENLVRVVFWLTENEALSVAHQAPDFWASRHRVFEFFHSQEVCDVFENCKQPAPQLERGVEMPLTATAAIQEDDLPGESALVLDIPEDDPALRGINMLLMMGVANWKENNHQKATESLQAALAIAKKSGNKEHQAMCHKAIALVQSDSGKNTEALQAYSQVIELGPDNVTVWNNMGLLYLKEGKFEDAQKAFTSALRKEPNDPVAWNGLGTAFANTGRLDDAIGCYKKAIQFNSSFATPWVKLGDVLVKLNRDQDALYAYMRTVEMDNKNVHAWSEIGSIYFKAGSYEQAIDAFRKALLLGVETALLHANLGDAYTHFGNYEEAVVHYEKAIEGEKDESILAGLWNKLGDVHRRSNDYEKAVTSYEMADKLTDVGVDDQESESRAVDELMTAEAHLDAPVAVQPVVQEAVVIEPAAVAAAVVSSVTVTASVEASVDPKPEAKNANLWARLGNTYMKAGAIDRAIEAYQKAVNMDTTDGQTFWLLAQAYAQKDNLSEAASYYQKSVDLFPNNSDKALSLSKAGDLFRQMKQYVSALEAFEAAIGLDPENETILSGLTKIQDDLDQLGETAPAKPAVVVSASVVAPPPAKKPESKPGSPEQSPKAPSTPNSPSAPSPIVSSLNSANVWNELGNIFTKSRSYDDAISAYNRAIELNPEYGWAYSNLALIYARQGKRAEAISLYHKSIELLWTEADKSVALNRLGDVYRQAGQYSDAIEAYQNADRLNQGNYALSAIREVNLDQLFPHFVS